MKVQPQGRGIRSISLHGKTFGMTMRDDNNDDGGDKKIADVGEGEAKAKRKATGRSNHQLQQLQQLQQQQQHFMYVLPMLYMFCRFLYENQSHSTIISFISYSQLPSVATLLPSLSPSRTCVPLPRARIIHTIRSASSNTLNGLRYRQLSW
jgi:hypothetical protein